MPSSTFCLLAICSAALAQTPPCEPRAEVVRAMDAIDRHFSEDWPRPEQRPKARAASEELIKANLRQVEVYQKYAQYVKGDAAEWTAVRARWVDQAKQNPNDAFLLTLGAEAVRGEDTPQAIRMLETAVAKDPLYGAPLLSLATIHARGKFEDAAESARLIARYFEVCPGSTNDAALSLAGRFGAKEIQTKIAAQLRARLATETQPEFQRSYASLWSMEFRVSPPTEQDKVRARVLQDLQGLEKSAGDTDADWLHMLWRGYRQAGAPVEKLAAVEDRMFRILPATYMTLSVRLEALKRTHPVPKSDASAAEWDRWSEAFAEATEAWLKESPRENFAWVLYFAALQELDSLPRESAVAAAEGLLDNSEDLHGPSAGTRMEVASFYLDRGIETARAVELVDTVPAMLLKSNKHLLEADDLTPKDVEERVEMMASDRLDLARLQLRAYQRAGLKEKAQALKPEIEGAEPKSADLRSAYWWNRALLARIEGRSADALTYYRQALDLRDSAPAMLHGRLKDPLMDEARSLWKDLNGGSEAFALWSKGSSKREAAVQGQWERPTKALPPFELTDMTGRTWNLKALEGRTVFINLWGTWCGPCKEELPHLQKFYERNKDRADLVILTLNADEQSGMVAPFLKQNGYTFPVLPAWTYINQVLPDWTIPQNWIVDAKGQWQWQQIGFDEQQPDWAKTMVEKIDSVKATK